MIAHIGSADAQKQFNKSPQEALKPYIRLQDLAFALKQAQPAAEDAAPHLVDYVENSAASLWKQMKGAFSVEFEKTLKKTQWPKKDITFTPNLEKEWTTGVERLLELQEPELRSQEDENQSIHHGRPLVLLPLEVMIKDLELRFKYHFEGDKPTNRSDKVSQMIYSLFY
jgi:RAD50-interacting protein 1